MQSLSELVRQRMIREGIPHSMYIQHRDGGIVFGWQHHEIELVLDSLDYQAATPAR